MTDIPHVESRLTELETKLAFAEDLIDTLNQTVFRQQAQLDLLQDQLRMLHRLIQEASGVEGQGRNPREEIPPHY
ncbi:SlyX protein [Betaproteobacteria bacterium SCN1]|jgi:SlyX protein|nr:SlyX protein [Betaproteobacteria bacterium SCN1]MBN8759106.1 SlyX family protein [Thiobacillus sp.]ODU91184.1 MAG: SlyX protein [Thiobacillus sp. SCN 65-179]OJW38086.1 MAG: SlyX protein [Thiobacillus sp. 65-69]